MVPSTRGLAEQLGVSRNTVWARVTEDVALERWRARALAQGVAFAIARDFALDRKPRPFVRLAFARYTEAELAAAIRVLVRALR